MLLMKVVDRFASGDAVAAAAADASGDPDAVAAAA